ncbi:ABC transporter ATP-binding protein [Picosynechococcus sp. PCC 7117]|uniref:ABC transporter ATP-binding protein n=1 Tax=Picosynechococcus sp. PCC 7117 TaxID=195498 RepID=UPI00081056A5|nr:ABC transporter ATP-binding protein [Picosynechococcus sp. PCC 7117]ANV88962.1 helicase [Picosynechococcus sp. PCC 7117]
MNTATSYQFLRTYLKSQQTPLFVLAIALLGSIGLQVVNPQIIRFFIDTAVDGGSQRLLLGAALTFIGFTVVQQLLAIASTYYSETIAWKVTNRLRLNLVEHCLKLDLDFHRRYSPGSLVEQVDGDVEQLSHFFSQFVLQVLGNGLLVVGILSVVWWENALAGISLSLFSLGVLGILGFLQRVAIGPWGQYRQASAEFYGMVAEYLGGLADLQANGATDYVRQRFYRFIRRWRRTYHRARWTSTLLWGGTVGLFTGGNVLALGIGTYLWSQQAITIGTIYLLYYYASLLQEPIERIREELEQFQQAIASLQRIQTLLQQPQPKPPSTIIALSNAAPSVEFQGVWFRYSTGDYALRDLSFQLPPGQVLGLLGHTGSGKSTLMRLLLRLHTIERGQICLGEVDLNHLCAQQLTQQIGFVTQDVQLFQATVRQNLTFFNPHIDDQDIFTTLEELGLGPWFAKLPQGLDTELGADSSTLSAGEAQLLALARVFLRDPRLVILDEVSSRLDPMTEKLLERAIRRLLKGRTGIIIAHRLETVAQVDKILILNQGQCLEYGDRQNLATNPDSHYARLLGLNQTL